MATTRRFSIVLTEPQLEWLRAEAGKLGISPSELLRRILDEYRFGRKPQ